MALMNDAVLKVGTAHFYTAPVGTPMPTNLREMGTEWKEMGHTSLSDILSAASSGGEVSTLPTLQNRNLRQTVAARTESFNINLLQFDVESLKLYYGSNAVITGEGNVQVPSEPVPTELAWMVVFYDGEATAGVYAEKASIFRNSDISISDTENLAQLPLTITPLTYKNNAHTMTFIPVRPAGDVVPAE